MSEKAQLRFDANLKWLFTELPFEQRFEAAAKAGFEAVEYSSPYEYTADFLNKCLADAGLSELVLINCPTGSPGTPTRNGSACIPDRVDEFRTGYLSALEYAVALGASVIHVNAGIRPDDVSRDRAFATYVTNIAWAAEQAASTNVTLALEVMNQRDAPGFVLESMEQAASVVQSIGGDHLGVMFDVYHLQVNQGDLATRLHKLFPLIAHIQIADAPHRTEPGTGEIAWPFVFDQIQSLGYDGWIGCEYTPVAGTVEGLTWMDEFRSAS
jgi:hydroxypyruvate isomerase